MPHRIFLFILVLLTACSKQRAALHYYNELAAYQNTPLKQINRFLPALREALSRTVGTPAEAKELEAMRIRVIKSLDRSLLKLRNKKMFEENYQLRDAWINYFTDVRDRYENEYLAAVKYRAIVFLSEAAFSEIRSIGAAITRKDNQANARLLDAQQAFAAQFGFTLKLE